MKKYIRALALLLLACCAPAAAQTGGQSHTTQTVAQTPAVSTVFAVLTKSAESNSAAAGREFTLRTVSDVVVEGEVVIPKGSTLVGRIKDVKVKGGGVAQTSLSVVFEKALTKGGEELPLQAIIAAVAAPPDESADADPTYGMLHSSEQKMSGGTATRAASSGELPAGSRASETSEARAADLRAGLGGPLLLKADSQGVVGYEGLSLSWRLDEPPPVTVFSSKGKNLKLDAGAQMLLRMAAPRPRGQKP